MKDILLLALLLAIMAGSLYDLLVDSTHGASSLHLIVEAGIFLAAAALITWLLNDLRRQGQALERLRHEIKTQHHDTSAATAELAETRTARAFMLFGRVTGTFD